MDEKIERELLIQSPQNTTVPHPPFWEVLKGGLRSYGLQVAMLVEKNLKLSLRNWFGTIIKIIIPALFILLVWGIQLGLSSQGGFDPTPHRINKEIPVTPDSDDVYFLYSPISSPFATKVMEELANTTGLSFKNLLGFKDSATMSNYFANHTSQIKIGAVSFQDMNGPVSYEATTYAGITDALLGNAYYPRETDALIDLAYTLQVLVDEAIMTVQARQNGTLKADQKVTLDVSYTRYPTATPVHAYDLVWSIGCSIAFFFAISVQTVIIGNQVNHDRSDKMVQGLLMMGLQRGAYWSSLFFTHAFFAILSSWGMVIMGIVLGYPFFTRCNAFVLFLIFWIGFLAANAFSLMLVSLVHKPGGNIMLITMFFLGGLSIAALCGISYTYSMIWTQAKWVSYFFFQTHFGSLVNAVFSNTSIPDSPGFYLADLYNQSSLPGVIPTPSNSLLGMVIQGSIFLLFAWLFDNWSPGDTLGVAQSFLFPFDPFYWGIIPNKKTAIVLSNYNENDQGSVLADMDVDVHTETNYAISQNKKMDQTSMIRCLKLSKTFLPSSKCCSCCGPVEEHRALDSLSIVAERDQIFCLLGHNGAGKTSTINILTGMLAPTSGDSFVLNRSILTDSNRIQKRIGVCCQHDILWPELTAGEHIRLFCQLKALNRSDWDRITKERLELVKLSDRIDHRVSTFSGGMKRRLSVAISTIGDPDIIFLDEPTTGLDLGNRIHLWGVIEKLKKDRCIFLTTHSMEEADRLADKIAIMALGRLRAIGTSQRLKKRFGAGYHIQVVTDSNTVDVVKSNISELAPSSTLTTTETTGNLSYNIESTRLDILQKMLQYLEHNSANDSPAEGHLVSDWSISQTTLEEVFMRLTHGDVHTFKKQLDEETPTVQLLSITYNESVLTLLPVDMETTLQAVRQELQKLENCPKDFVFGSNGVPIPTLHEVSIKAIAFFPSLTIHEPHAFTETDVNTQVKILKAEIESLKEIIRQRDETIKQLAQKSTEDQ